MTRSLWLALGFVLVGCGSSSSGAGSGAAGADNAGAGTGSGTGGGSPASGGSVGTGGATSSGGSVGTGGVGTGGGGGSAPHNVLACDSIGEVGHWENITPPQIVSKFTGSANDGMTNRFAVDPLNSGTVYLGTNKLGIWKTTDCGATWIHVNTGRNGNALDCGLQWNLKIDPVDPTILYANSGYGCMGSGLWKSTDSGVDWDEIWPKNAGIQNANGFVDANVVDPADHEHLLLSFHERPDIAESKDGGASWRLISWGGGQVWLLDTKSWLSDKNDTLWRTSDSGATWNLVSNANSTSHSEGFLYRAKNGAYYLGTQEGVVRSPDGITWTLVPNSGHLVKGVTGDGTSVFASSGGVPWLLDAPIQPYLSSPESDGKAFTLLPSPEMNPGADDLQCDRDHHILYSSNCMGGFWRVRTQ